MAYNYVGSGRVKVCVGHPLAIASVNSEQVPVFSGAGLPEEEWLKSISNTAVADIAAMKKDSVLSASYHMDSNTVTSVMENNPNAFFSEYQWAILLPGHSENVMLSNDTRTLTVEGVGRGFKNGDKAIANAIQSRGALVSCLQLYHNVSKLSKEYTNGQEYTGSNEFSKYRAFLGNSEYNPVSKVCAISRTGASRIAQLAFEKFQAKTSERWAIDIQTEDPTSPKNYGNQNANPYSTAIAAVKMMNPGSDVIDVDVMLFYDTEKERYEISVYYIGSDADVTRKQIAREQELLKNALIDRNSGIDTKVPPSSTVEDVPDGSDILKKQILEWRSYYAREAAKINSKTVSNSLTDAMRVAGKTDDEIAAMLADIKDDKGGAGTTAWESMVKTLGGIASGIGDYLSKFSPLDYVGAYAGYKATDAIGNNKWLWFGLAAIGLIVVLK